MSLDGFIAGENDDLTFLDPMHLDGEDYGYAEFNKTIDTMIWGRRTYDKILKLGAEYLPKDKRCIVVSKSKSGSENGVEFYSGDIKELITSLKSEEGKNIYCDGGAVLVNSLLKENLIDRFIISVIPCFVGKGIRLFDDERSYQALKLISSKGYNSGLVQLTYEKES